jgi:hypothetical protein
MAEDLPAALVKACEEWMEREADGHADNLSLFADNYYQPYLRELLELAFLAGANAQEKIDAAALAHLKQLLKM